MKLTRAEECRITKSRERRHDAALKRQERDRARRLGRAIREKREALEKESLLTPLKMISARENLSDESIVALMEEFYGCDPLDEALGEELRRFPIIVGALKRTHDADRRAKCREDQEMNEAVWEARQEEEERLRHYCPICRRQPCWCSPAD